MDSVPLDITPWLLEQRHPEHSEVFRRELTRASRGGRVTVTFLWMQLTNSTFDPCSRLLDQQASEASWFRVSHVEDNVRTSNLLQAARP